MARKGVRRVSVMAPWWPTRRTPAVDPAPPSSRSRSADIAYAAQAGLRPAHPGPEAPCLACPSLPMRASRGRARPSRRASITAWLCPRRRRGRPRAGVPCHQTTDADYRIGSPGAPTPSPPLPASPGRRSRTSSSPPATALSTRRRPHQLLPFCGHALANVPGVRAIRSARPELIAALSSSPSNWQGNDGCHSCNGSAATACDFPHVASARRAIASINAGSTTGSPATSTRRSSSAFGHLVLMRPRVPVRSSPPAFRSCSPAPASPRPWAWRRRSRTSSTQNRPSTP